jgi:hypothetical protein
MKVLAVGLASLALVACGGGGGGSAPATVSSLVVTGTAATGLAIPGATINGKCKVGTGTATTLTDGGYTLQITDGQLPCVLEITNPVDGAKLHTVAFGTGSAVTANITPLTEMITARVLSIEPHVYFAAFDASAVAQKITSAAVQTAQAEVGLVLTDTVDTSALGNFISAPLKAATAGDPTSGDTQDKLLDALKLKLTGTQIATLSTALAGNQATDAIKLTVTSMTVGVVAPPVANSIATPTEPVVNVGGSPYVFTGKITDGGSRTYAATGSSSTSAVGVSGDAVGGYVAIANPAKVNTSNITIAAGLPVIAGGGSISVSQIGNSGTMAISNYSTPSSNATLTIGAIKPHFANAGVAQNVVAGSAVTLDGSASSDGNTAPLSYVWTLISKPLASTAVLSLANSAKPTFTADAVGTYVASLTVNDGSGNSPASTVTITASLAQ